MLLKAATGRKRSHAELAAASEEKEQQEDELRELVRKNKQLQERLELAEQQ